MTNDPTALQERIARAIRLADTGDTLPDGFAARMWDEGVTNRDKETRLAAAVLPIIAAEVQASKAEAILMDGFDMAVADRLADAGYTEYAEDEDGGVTWVCAPLGEVLHIVRISATEYETGDQA